MREMDGELPTPPEVSKIFQILAPKGTAIGRKIAAMNIATELHEYQRNKIAEKIQLGNLLHEIQVYLFFCAQKLGHLFGDKNS